MVGDNVRVTITLPADADLVGAVMATVARHLPKAVILEGGSERVVLGLPRGVEPPGPPRDRPGAGDVARAHVPDIDAGVGCSCGWEGWDRREERHLDWHRDHLIPILAATHTPEDG